MAIENYCSDDLKKIIRELEDGEYVLRKLYKKFFDMKECVDREGIADMRSTRIREFMISYKDEVLNELDKVIKDRFEIAEDEETRLKAVELRKRIWELRRLLDFE